LLLSATVISSLFLDISSLLLILDSEKFSHTISNKKCKKTLDKDAIMCGRIGSI
jgi:hypothetical protein